MAQRLLPAAGLTGERKEDGHQVLEVMGEILNFRSEEWKVRGRLEIISDNLLPAPVAMM